MNEREKIIADYFNSWIEKDISVPANTFAGGAVYIESWGPVYRGLDHILYWIEDWNRMHSVMEWNIYKFYHIGNVCICEWFFKCKCYGDISEFNGVSIITFNDENKIVLLKEYKSETQDIFPYE